MPSCNTQKVFSPSLMVIPIKMIPQLMIFHADRMCWSQRSTNKFRIYLISALSNLFSKTFSVSRCEIQPYWIWNPLSVHCDSLSTILKCPGKKGSCINTKQKIHGRDFWKARWAVILLLCHCARGYHPIKVTSNQHFYCCSFILAAREIQNDSFQHVLSITR